MGWCKVDQLTMFSTDVDMYRQKYQRKGFQDAILEAELNPACQPALPEEEVSPNSKQDESALIVTKKDKIRRFRGNVLPRRRFNDREFFFGSFNDVGSTMSASEKEEAKERMKANQEKVVSEDDVAPPSEAEFTNILSRLADTITALKQSTTVPREHLDLIFCSEMLRDY